MYKIISKSNFDSYLFVEEVIADNISDLDFAYSMKDALNKEYSSMHSREYYQVVDKDYKLYNGYEEMLK